MALALAAVALLAGGCSGGSAEPAATVPPDQLQAVVANAVNNNGWHDVQPEVWASLALDACAKQAWEHSVNADLTADFLDTKGFADREHADQLPLIIWLNLHIVCPERVPADAVPPPGAIG